uniref:Uncharacterized protein n=1 Tax=Rhizophora mucronata TaxID=61149 RepID=A0A2P2JB48_RHIMU
MQSYIVFKVTLFVSAAQSLLIWCFSFLKCFLAVFICSFDLVIPLINYTSILSCKSLLH